MYHKHFGSILDKVEVTLYTNKEDVEKFAKKARAIYKRRDARVEGMTDEDVEIYYSCTLCQSFAPSHVCVVSPERTGLCGAYNWFDCKASYEINPTGPNQPVEKGECLDETLGQWKGVNDFLYKASRQKLDHYNFYSIVHDPMTTCGCCECIAAVLPTCNGIMTVHRDYTSDTPSGMKFTTLAGTIGGGASTPGFVGHSKFNIVQRKFISGDGGLLRLVWMPKALKEELRDGLERRGKELGVPDLIDKIADETVGTDEATVLAFLQKVNHPAVNMDPMMG
jgi:acetyl-CoA synthase